MKHGDFTKLAESYSKHRPAYSPTVLAAILGALNKDRKQIDFVDVGAGTGIWTRMVAAQGCRTTAVEPNDQMREYGQKGNAGLNIHWQAGSAEQTNLDHNCCDLLSMASSFHWPDFDKATKEFYRLIRPEGYFVALWNPRYIEANPMLVEIEEKLKQMVPGMKRKSSGRSEFCDTLTDRLLQCGHFEDALYLEGRHVEIMTPDRYIGIWDSVNDIRVQAGEQIFKQFMDFVKDKVQGLKQIETTYLTRAWMAKTKKKA
ncbi:MAG: class I SAM-dependent methyltransferase [Candidatus Omnitrophica bacterium]|nr:class I SAM-dependent methyltransferase [Candidatus Omnitrophota bacterium]